MTFNKVRVTHEQIVKEHKYQVYYIHAKYS